LPKRGAGLELVVAGGVGDVEGGVCRGIGLARRRPAGQSRGPGRRSSRLQRPHLGTHAQLRQRHLEAHDALEAH
jgi:hypothetical protein